MSEIVAWRYRWQHDTKWVHSSEEPEAYPNRIVEPLCVAGGEFMHKVIENAFSWAIEDCNYLNPKHMDRLIEATRSGMKPEEAAEWRSDAQEVEARKALLAAGKCPECHGSGILLVEAGHGNINEDPCEYCAGTGSRREYDLPF